MYRSSSIKTISFVNVHYLLFLLFFFHNALPSTFLKDLILCSRICCWENSLEWTFQEEAVPIVRPSTKDMFYNFYTTILSKWSSLHTISEQEVINILRQRIALLMSEDLLWNPSKFVYKHSKYGLLNCVEYAVIHGACWVALEFMQEYDIKPSLSVWRLFLNAGHTCSEDSINPFVHFIIDHVQDPIDFDNEMQSLLMQNNINKMKFFRKVRDALYARGYKPKNIYTILCREFEIMGIFNLVLNSFVPDYMEEFTWLYRQGFLDASLTKNGLKCSAYDRPNKIFLYEDSNENPLLFEHVKKNSFAIKRDFIKSFMHARLNGEFNDLQDLVSHYIVEPMFYVTHVTPENCSAVACYIYHEMSVNNQKEFAEILNALRMRLFHCRCALAQRILAYIDQRALSLMHFITSKTYTDTVIYCS